MGVEIERKFLLCSDGWRREVVASADLVQGYLARTERCSIRVRIADEEATLNFKGLTVGMRRSEYEYPVPLADAREMIDEFHGANAGLVVAELELESLDETFERPAWLGREVTDETRYYNIALLERPFREWNGD